MRVPIQRLPAGPRASVKMRWSLSWRTGSGSTTRAWPLPRSRAQRPSAWPPTHKVSPSASRAQVDALGSRPARVMRRTWLPSALAR